MTADAAGDRRDVIVVGGGQSGVAIGYLLAQQGRRFTILEAADAPAAAWRARWDSLRLFTPVRYDSLLGRAFPGDPDSYPGRDDVLRVVRLPRSCHRGDAWRIAPPCVRRLMLRCRKATCGGAHGCAV